MTTYKTRRGELAFGDVVEIVAVALPLEQRVGRLIQVRRGCGQFRSDVVLIRKPDGKLHSFENVGVVAFDGRIECPADPEDSTSIEYTIRGEYPETGFVIENPGQPMRSGAFAITVTTEHGALGGES